MDNRYVTTKQYTMFKLTKQQSIKFYTYKQLLYILIQFNIITYNQKNNKLSTYLDKLITTNWIRLTMDNINVTNNLIIIK